MPCMLDWLGSQRRQSTTGALKRAIDISKHLALPGDHNAGGEMFGVIQDGLLLREAS